MRTSLIFALLASLAAPAIAQGTDTWFSDAQAARLASAAKYLETTAVPKAQAALKPCGAALEAEARHRIRAPQRCHRALEDDMVAEDALHACARVAFSLKEFLTASGLPHHLILLYTRNVHNGAQWCINEAVQLGWQDPQRVAKK